MGWFWSDVSLRPGGVIPPQPSQSAFEGLPAECPMSASSPTRQNQPAKPASLEQAPSPSDETPSRSILSRLNPLNYMPSSIPNERTYSTQDHSLPLSRTTSSIPRGDGSTTNWEYPSPQQMYNAMLRKGYTDTPSDAVESMVEVHNFLNEGAWAEIVAWEDIFRGGLSEAWKKCRIGEEGMMMIKAKEEFLQQRRRDLGLKQTERPKEKDEKAPTLVRFQGRPKDMTPKAASLQALGWLWPSRFGVEPPFDRHDWYVTRHSPDGSNREIRYVIDYYTGEPEPTGEPVFYLDIRPAIDSPTAAVERLMRWSGDVWLRASGRKAELPSGLS